MNLKADQGMREGWYSDKHFLITVLVHIKRIFYLTSFSEFEDTDEGISFIEDNEALKLYVNHVFREC